MTLDVAILPISKNSAIYSNPPFSNPGLYRLQISVLLKYKSPNTPEFTFAEIISHSNVFKIIAYVCNIYLFYCLECLAPLGMENFKITPAQISASSQYDENYVPSHGRLHYKGIIGGWAAGANDTHPWFQVDFGIVTTVTHVATQGRYNTSQWVTQYKLQYSDDRNSFQVFKQLGENTDKVRI